MRAVGPALELRVVLHADEEGVAAHLHRLGQAAVRRAAGHRQPRRLQLAAEGVVELIAVAVPLAYLPRAVAALQRRARGYHAGPRAQAQRAALVHLVALAGHEIDHLVRAPRRELAGVGVRPAEDVPRVLYDRHLHPQAEAQIGHAALAGVLRGQHHALHAAAAEAAGHQHAVRGGEALRHILRRQRLGVHPVELHLRAQFIAGVVQRLHHGEIGVVQLHILAHQRHAHALRAAVDALHQRLPRGEVRRGHIQLKIAAHRLCQPLALEHQRRGVEAGQRDVLDHAPALHIAEAGDLVEHAALRDGLVAAQDNDIRRDAQALQLFHRVLCGLCLVLAGGLQIGHERDVDIERVAAPLFPSYLAYGLQEGLGLDVAHRAAYFRYHHVRARLGAQAVDEFLDLVRDVGDDLHRAAEIFPPPLLVQHVPVDAPGGEVGKAVEVLVDEALVVPQVEVRLRPVLRDIHLPVLIGAHGARIDVYVGIQLLRGHLQPPRLQQPAQRGRRDALAQPGDHAPGDENILCHVFSPPFSR